MGPRLDSRGNIAQSWNRDRVELASMGPRLDSRGNGAAKAFVEGYAGLQWGRDLIVAETGWRVSLADQQGRFNGAAT